MKTTKADFELFKRECQKWIDRYELNQYTFYFSIGETEGGLASYSVNVEAQAIEIIFEKDWGDAVEGVNKNKSIKEIAFHEITEILISPLRILAEDRNFSEEKLEEETHRIIHKQQKVLM